MRGVCSFAFPKHSNKRLYPVYAFGVLVVAADTVLARTPVEYQRQQMANAAPFTVRSEDGTATIGACATPVTTERTLRRRPQTTAGVVGGRHKQRTHLGKHRFNGLQVRASKCDNFANVCCIAGTKYDSCSGYKTQICVAWRRRRASSVG